MRMYKAKTTTSHIFVSPCWDSIISLLNKPKAGMYILSLDAILRPFLQYQRYFDLKYKKYIKIYKFIKAYKIKQPSSSIMGTSDLARCHKMGASEPLSGSTFVIYA
jgi:hypothetical protein